VLVSDAGTPAISDPGYYLVQQCIKKNIPFTLLPGPSSVISALVMSGLSTSSFSFHGFIPRKKNQKKDFFKSLRHEKNTVVLFESAKRIEDTLQVLIEEYSSTNKIALCREMTKLHETIERGTIEDVFQRLKAGKIVLKGEFVVVIECSSELKKSFIIDKKIKESFLNFLPAKDAAKLISLLTKENKRDIYKQLLD
jgi:16S rRNA (cytidine1402-2'-O)-methyltransferase